jgi:hypothetical protein
MTNSINSIQGNLWKWLTIGFGSIILIYGVMRITPIMRGVVIETQLPEFEEMPMDSIMLTGKANHARTLSVNGRSILIDPSGNFNDELILAPGMNKIQILAEDIRGKRHSKELIVMGKERVVEIKTAQADNINTEISNTN